MKKQARFWIDYKGSVVRLKLGRDQFVHVKWGGNTDEGYSFTLETYSFDGRTVAVDISTSARDCDGAIDRYNTCACPFEALSTGWRDPEANVTFPKWECVRERQRDHSAEAMNY